MSTRTTALFRVVNAAMRPALRSRRDPAAAWAKSVAQAEKSAGVEVADADRQWVDDFEFLIRCVADVPGLSPIGWTTTLMDARARLINRLRIRSLHERHPEIGEEPIERPIFVVGLPRTATTLAHRVLAGSPQTRGPLLLEMTRTDLEQDPKVLAKRVKKAERQFSATKWAPDFDHIHPIDVRKPEESMFLLPHGSYHNLFHAPMPKYRTWFESRNSAPDYQYLRSALQVLQHGRAKRRWVLKYPFDLAQMPVIRKVFPDATFVWTHRDPVTVAGSLCSLADLSQALFVAEPDREAIGRLALDLMVTAVESGRAYRQRHPDSVIDVEYYTLVSAPERHVPVLYRRLGLPWTSADGERLAAAVNSGGRQRDRKHEYSIGSYGLTSDGIEDAFGDYGRWITTINT